MVGVEAPGSTWHNLPAATARRAAAVLLVVVGGRLRAALRRVVGDRRVALRRVALRRVVGDRRVGDLPGRGDLPGTGDLQVALHQAEGADGARQVVALPEEPRRAAGGLQEALPRAARRRVGEAATGSLRAVTVHRRATHPVLKATRPRRAMARPRSGVPK